MANYCAFCGKPDPSDQVCVDCKRIGKPDSTLSASNKTQGVRLNINFLGRSRGFLLPSNINRTVAITIMAIGFIWIVANNAPDASTQNLSQSTYSSEKKPLKSNQLAKNHMTGDQINFARNYFGLSIQPTTTLQELSKQIFSLLREISGRTPSVSDITSSLPSGNFLYRLLENILITEEAKEIVINQLYRLAK